MRNPFIPFLFVLIPILFLINSLLNNYAVIIKGTDIYDPNQADSRDLSILDVQQMFGRAGRPQYDTTG